MCSAANDYSLCCFLLQPNLRTLQEPLRWKLLAYIDGDKSKWRTVTKCLSKLLLHRERLGTASVHTLTWTRLFTGVCGGTTFFTQIISHLSDKGFSTCPIAAEPKCNFTLLSSPQKWRPLCPKCHRVTEFVFSVLILNIYRLFYCDNW